MKSPLDKGLNGSINGVVEKWNGLDTDVCRKPFGKKRLGHIVLVDALARGFGPACETTNADFDLFIAEIIVFDLSSGLAHSYYQVA